MADIEQEGVSPATAGGASAPWSIRKHGGRTVSLHEGDEPRALVFEPDHAARILAALNPPSLPPFKLRPVLGEPAVNMDGDEEGNEWPDSVGWSLSLGCQLTFSHGGDETGDATAQVAMSDMDLRRGITKRTATRAQLAAFGRLLVEQFGESASSFEASVEHWQGLAEQRGVQVEQFARDIRELAADRDRLRRELDVAAKQLARVGLQVATIHVITGDIGKELKATPLPAEPRRWVAGDPEPEIGTKVRRDTYKFTRHLHGWHRDGVCGFTPDKCPNRGGTWAWMTSTGRPLYEVVSTDGH